MKHQLSPQDTERLLRLGLDAYVNPTGEFLTHKVYALGDLLDVLPVYVEMEGHHFYLSILRNNSEYIKWEISYRSTSESKTICYAVATELVDAAMEMVKFLLTHDLPLYDD